MPLSSALATTYYVDSVAGLDSYNGTSTGTPWQTLTKVNALAIQPGDTILFKRGSSWTGTLTPLATQGTSTAPIVFDAYGTGPAPIINGNGGYNAVMIWSPKYFTFQNFNITNDAASDGVRAGIRITFLAPTGTSRTYTGINILNNEIHHVRGITVHAQNPYSTAALFVEMQSASSTTLVTVQDLLIQGNDFHDNRSEGFYMLAPSVYGSHPEIWATNVRIRENIFDQGGADHIVVNGANAPLIEANAGYDAGILATHPSSLSIAGMWTCYYTKDALFQFNEVARTRNESVNGASGDSQAFDVDLGTSGSHTFQYNYTHDNEGGVLESMYEATAVKTIIYRYNLSVNDARNTWTGTQFSTNTSYGYSAAYIYNNVIYSTRQEGLKFYNKQAVYYYNNIFDAPSGIYPSYSTFSNNCYFGHTPDVTDPYKVLGDPQFVGPLPTTAGGDGYLAANTDIFKLQSTSPCINWGLSVADNGGEDFWGNPLYAGGYADIGAHEVVGGNHPAPVPVTIADDPAGGAVTYTGASWRHYTDTLCYNSTRSYTEVVGHYVQFAFTGTNVALYGTKGLGMGNLNISIDGGTPVVVDCLWPVNLYRTKLFQVSGLANTAHTIKATVATKDAYSTYNGIGIDYFQQDPGTPPSSPVVTLVDNPASASVVYTGTWSHGTGDTAFVFGTKSTSGTVGDYVDFTFTGTGVGLYGVKSSNYGKLSISIDGGASTVINCYQPTLPDYLVKLYEINGLSSGTHTVRATVAAKDAASSGNSITIDYFQGLAGGGPIAVTSTADAYVRDGTYATTNYGTDPSLVTKLDATGYQRETFLKFNVGGFSNAGSAKLKLMPTAAGTDTAVTYTVELVTTDTWTETGVTWNTKPAGSGVILATLSGSEIQVGVPVIIDITNQVRSEAAGDGVISIRIRSNNTGSLKLVTFGSKEDVAANRPQLIIQ